MTAPDAKTLQDFIAQAFSFEKGSEIAVDHVSDDDAVLRWLFDSKHLRPGGTVSGPTMMALADTALFVLVLRRLGLGAAVGAVTVNLNMDFLRRPQPAALLAKARLLKIGKRLATGHVELFSEGRDEPVAQASVTYAVPPME